MLIDWKIQILVVAAKRRPKLMFHFNWNLAPNLSKYQLSVPLKESNQPFVEHSLMFSPIVYSSECLNIKKNDRILTESMHTFIVNFFLTFIDHKSIIEKKSWNSFRWNEMGKMNPMEFLLLDGLIKIDSSELS